MTVKEFLPHLTRRERFRIGYAFVARYKSKIGESPTKKPEDDYLVCDYTHEFLMNSLVIMKRFSKKYPMADITHVKPYKRPRISTKKVELPNG